jgi:hypothetical protein
MAGGISGHIPYIGATENGISHSSRKVKACNYHSSKGWNSAYLVTHYSSLSASLPLVSGKLSTKSSLCLTEVHLYHDIHQWSSARLDNLCLPLLAIYPHRVSNLACLHTEYREVHCNPAPTTFSAIYLPFTPPYLLRSRRQGGRSAGVCLSIYPPTRQPTSQPAHLLVETRPRHCIQGRSQPVSQSVSQ